MRAFRILAGKQQERASIPLTIDVWRFGYDVRRREAVYTTCMRSLSMLSEKCKDVTAARDLPCGNHQETGESSAVRMLMRVRAIAAVPSELNSASLNIDATLRIIDCLVLHDHGNLREKLLCERGTECVSQTFGIRAIVDSRIDA